MAQAHVLMFGKTRKTDQKKFARQLENWLESLRFAAGRTDNLASAKTALERKPSHFLLVILDTDSEHDGLELLDWVNQADLLTLSIAIVDPRDPNRARLVNEAAQRGCRAFLPRGPELHDDLRTLMATLSKTVRGALEESEGAPGLEVLMNLASPTRSFAIEGGVDRLDFDQIPNGGYLASIPAQLQEIEERIDKALERQLWREQGAGLLRELLAAVNPALVVPPHAWEELAHASGASPDAPARTVTLGGPLDTLALPFELIPVDAHDPARHLALTYPTVRRVSGYTTRTKALRPWQLYGRNPLRVLLIGANVSHYTRPGAAATTPLEPLCEPVPEVESLTHLLRKLPDHLVGEVKPLFGEGATITAVTDALRSGAWDIVHFAGHALREDGVQYLPLWRDPHTRGELLSAFELRALLEAHPPKLVSLTSCSVFCAECVLRDARGSIIDAVLGAGVPQVLGFRWPVEDSCVVDFILDFYTSLLGQRRSAAEALLDARRAAYGKRAAESPIWASALLVSQQRMTAA